MSAHVNAQHVHQEEGAHRPAKAVFAHRLVDLLCGGGSLFHGQHRLVEVGHQQPVDQEAWAFLDDDRDLAQLLGELLHRVDRVLVGLVSGDDLHQLHDVGRVEKVHPDHLVGPAGCCSHLGDRQSRRVGGQDRLGLANLVQLLVHRCLIFITSGTASITMSTSEKPS